jgi:hypothetical protein
MISSCGCKFSFEYLLENKEFKDLIPTGWEFSETLVEHEETDRTRTCTYEDRIFRIEIFKRETFKLDDYDVFTRRIVWKKTSDGYYTKVYHKDT